MTVRLASPEDLDWVLTLERAVSTAPHWRRLAYEEALKEGRRCLLIAEDRGSQVGFSVGSLLGEEGELESVVVDPACRRRGAGRALVKAVLAWAAGQGATTVVLEVRQGSLGAQRLYAEAGFAVAGVRPGYYRQPDEDGLVMRVGLPAQSSGGGAV